MTNLILFEDDDLLAIHKPAGINTHRPDRLAPEGIHEWLERHRAGPGGATKAGRLAILHRLDKETSGVLLFGKTRAANQSLARQFESHSLRKEYLLLSDHRPTRTRSEPRTPGAVTEFEYVADLGGRHLIAARPLTGKTHQIRQHAAITGFPVLGDTEYGGSPAPRLMLHALRLTFEHPVTRQPLSLHASVPAVFETMDPLDAAWEFRQLLFGGETTDTTAYRLLSGAADGFADVIVDNFGGHLLVQWQTERAMAGAAAFYARLQARCAPLSIWEQVVTPRQRTAPVRVGRDWKSAAPAGAMPAAGLSSRACRGMSVVSQTPDPTAEIPRGRGMTDSCTASPEPVVIRENGLQFVVRFNEGLAPGIFLDQRENRWRLRQRPQAGKSLLNCFAYTCGFSVAAARAGARTTSVDLSKNYLAWGRANFDRNGLDPAAHEFVTGDVLSWLRRFARQGRTWDTVILDPPTFSTTKQGRVFQAGRDYAALVGLALPVVARGGLLLCSTNQRSFGPEEFNDAIRDAVRESGRAVRDSEFVTLPFDFRVAPDQRAYLKTVWTWLAD